MVIAQGLETGMYLVGREDGAIDPFFVQVLDNGAMKCHEDLEPLMDHAQDHAISVRNGVPNVRRI